MRNDDLDALMMVTNDRQMLMLAMIGLIMLGVATMVLLIVHRHELANRHRLAGPAGLHPDRKRDGASRAHLQRPDARRSFEETRRESGDTRRKVSPAEMTSAADRACHVERPKHEARRHAFSN